MFANDASIPKLAKQEIISSLVPEIISTNNLHKEKTSTLLKDVVSAYLEYLTCSKREINDRQHFLNNILMPNTQINDVTLFKHSDIRELQKAFSTRVKHRGKLVSMRTTNKYMTWLKNFFQFCLNEEYIEINPALGIKALKNNQSNERTQRDALTLEEIKTLLANSKCNEMVYFIKLCYLTGMRLSEFTKANITTLEGIPVFDLNSINWQLKTKSSYRIIPIHSYLGGEIAVKEFLDRHDAKSIQNLARRVKYLIDKFIQDSGSKTCYSLRHSFATHLIQQGIDSNIVSELMGHRHNTMTLNRYTKGYTTNTLQESLHTLSI